MAEFIIGERVYKAKKAALEAIQAVRDRILDTAITTPDDDEFLRDLVALHPDAQQKVGVGIVDFVVRKNMGNTYGFWIRRTDGSETDFSYMKCLNGATQDEAMRSAMRISIRPQIVAFRSGAFDFNKTIPCAVSGNPVSPSTCHIDHESPTFIEIADEFARQEGGYPQIAVAAGSGVIGHRFVDAGVEHRWIAFHESRAQLRVVSKTSNLSTLRRGVKRR